MKKPKLTPTETKAVKAKVEAELAGQSQALAAQKVFPNATPESASVMMSRELKKVNVQEALEQAFIKHGISIDSATKPIADGLVAEKQNQFTGEIDPDHSIRLRAAGMALGLMVPKTEGTTVNLNFNQVANEQRERYGI